MLAVGGVFMKLMLTCVEDSGQQNSKLDGGVLRDGISWFSHGFHHLRPSNLQYLTDIKRF